MRFVIQKVKHNRLSSSEDNNESADSSNDDCEDNGEFNLNEPLIHNLYPKWLIEVEKKRAEAELLRAKAEEKRASASVRSAEVALLQAEAMKKLANAATTQALAVARIAAAIENRTCLEDVGSVSSSVDATPFYMNYHCNSCKAKAISMVIDSMLINIFFI